MKKVTLWIAVFLMVALTFCGCKSQQKAGTPRETGNTETEILDTAVNFETGENAQGDAHTTHPSAPSQGGIELPLIPG